MPDTFQTTLVTPEAQVLDEQVSYASIPAWDGQVGLAPMRAPLVVKLGPGALRLDFPQGGSRWFFVDGGFAQMKDDRLTILTDNAVPAEDVVEADALALLRDAEARVAISEDDFARKQHDLAKARTLLSLLEHAAVKP